MPHMCTCCWVQPLIISYTRSVGKCTLKYQSHNPVMIMTSVQCITEHLLVAARGCLNTFQLENEKKFIWPAVVGCP